MGQVPSRKRIRGVMCTCNIISCAYNSCIILFTYALILEYERGSALVSLTSTTLVKKIELVNFTFVFVSARADALQFRWRKSHNQINETAVYTFPLRVSNGTTHILRLWNIKTCRRVTTKRSLRFTADLCSERGVNTDAFRLMIFVHSKETI